MEKVNETKKEVKVETSLEKKKKSDLIEIILRKDALERNLRNDMKGTLKTLEDTKEELKSVKARVSKLISQRDKLNEENNKQSSIIMSMTDDYQKECDNYVTEIAQLKEKNKIKNITKNVIIAILLFISVILCSLL